MTAAAAAAAATTFLLILVFTTTLFHHSHASRSSFACADAATSNLPFCQKNLPVGDRVRDLPEKVGLLGSSAAPVPRLGIRRYEWWSEALHGGKFPAATGFPQVITTAASFSASLWEGGDRTG